MVLDRIVEFISDEDPWEPSHVRGRAHTKVCFQVHEVFNVKAQTQMPKSNLWYTIKSQIHGKSKSMANGKIRSKRIVCGGGHFDTFDTQHEILVDTDMVHGLVLKVKTASAILHRRVTIGSYKLKVSSTPDAGSNLDEVVKLTDKEGQEVGDVHISVTITRTTLPAMHFAPQPCWKPFPDVLIRLYTYLSHEGLTGLGCCGQESRMVSFFQGRGVGSIKVQGDDEGYCLAQQIGANWKISEKVANPRSASSPTAVTRKLWLECVPHPTAQKAGETASHPMHFSLQDNLSSSSSLALLPGNAADTSQVESAWGTWTLVRQFEQSEEKEPKGDEFLALINLAGPLVEVWTIKEVSVALALANAMFWSSMLHVRAELEIHRKIHTAVTRQCSTSVWCSGSGTGSFEHGRGFFVLGEASSADKKGERIKAADVTELRAKLSGVAAYLQNEERFLAAFLQLQCFPGDQCDL